MRPPLSEIEPFSAACRSASAGRASAASRRRRSAQRRGACGGGRRRPVRRARRCPAALRRSACLLGLLLRRDAFLLRCCGPAMKYCQASSTAIDSMTARKRFFWSSLLHFGSGPLGRSLVICRDADPASARHRCGASPFRDIGGHGEEDMQSRGAVRPGGRVALPPRDARVAGRVQGLSAALARECRRPAPARSRRSRVPLRHAARPRPQRRLADAGGCGCAPRRCRSSW